MPREQEGRGFSRASPMTASLVGWRSPKVGQQGFICAGGRIVDWKTRFFWQGPHSKGG
jgi:hypothetical protein